MDFISNLRVIKTLICLLGLALTFTSCEQEVSIPRDDAGLDHTSPSTPSEVNDALDIPIQEDYTKFGINAREHLYGYFSAYKSDQVVTAGDPSAIPTVEEQLNNMDQYAQIGILTNKEVALLREFVEFTSTFSFRPDEKTSSVQDRYQQWMSDHGITSTQHTLIYHAFKASEELIFKTQVSATLPQKPIADLGAKSNDGNYCVISGTLCNSTTDGGQLGTLVRAAVIAGIGGIFKESVEWTSEEEFLGLVNLGNLAESAVGGAIGTILTSWWDNIFCSTQCDNCSSAIGAVAVFDDQNCDFIGIRLIGNFEFADRFEVFIDDNLDGVFTGPFVIFNPTSDLITAQQITGLGSSSFNFRVEVVCDGGVDFPWAGSANGLFFDLDNLNFPIPTATVSSPPRQNGFFYPPGTPLTFSTFSVATRGWTFNNWTASAASPSTGSNLSSFTTTYSGSNPITRSVNLSWSHPCEPDYLMPGASFVVCPISTCGN